MCVCAVCKFVCMCVNVCARVNVCACVHVCLHACAWACMGGESCVCFCEFECL